MEHETKLKTFFVFSRFIFSFAFSFSLTAFKLWGQATWNKCGYILQCT